MTSASGGGSVAQLAAEYETLAAAAQRDRWTRQLHECGLSSQDADQVITAPAFGALTAELRRAEADGHDVELLLSQLVAQRGLDDADDPAGVLHHRLATATARPARHTGLTIQRHTPRRIDGLIPEAAGSMTDEYRRTLQERGALIEQRVTDLVQTAIREHEPWLSVLGPEPSQAEARRTWQAAVRMVVAYRDRYGITGSTPLGRESVGTDVQAIDGARSAAALRRVVRPKTACARRPGVTRQVQGIHI